MSESKPSVGRIVHLKVKEGAEPGQCVYKPMIITDVHGDTCVSGVVFDAFMPDKATARTSVMQGDVEGQWVWPARV